MNKLKNLKLNYILLIIIGLLPILMILINMLNIKKLTINFYTPFLIIIYISIVILIYCLIFKSEQIKLPKFLTISIILFMISSLLSCILSEYPISSILGNGYFYGYVGYVCFLSVFITAFLLEKNLKETLIKLLVTISTIIAIITLIRTELTYTLLGIDKNIEYYFYQGNFYHFNHYGYYLLITSLLSVYLFLKNEKYKKIFYLITSAILIFTLIINDTFSVYLAFILGLIFMTIYYLKVKKNKNILLIILIFTIFSILINRDGVYLVKRNFNELISDVNSAATLKEENFNKIATNRGELWKYATIFFKEKPILGYGVDNVRLNYYNKNIPFDKPHNFILELLTSTGIIGTILFLFILFIIIFNSLKKYFKLTDLEFISLIICICYLASALFSNSRIYTAPYFYIFLGFTAQKLIKDKSND